MDINKQKSEIEAKVIKYQNLVKEILSNYMDNAIPTIIDDTQIVNDCIHLMYIPDKYKEIEELLKTDKVIPEGFEEALANAKEAIRNMQDQDQGDEEVDQEEELYDFDQEEQDEAHMYDQIGNFTEPTLSKFIE